MTTNLPTEARDTFLAHFPQTKRGTVANWFLEPIRERGTSEPYPVVCAVLEMLEHRLTRPWTSDEARVAIHEAMEIILDHDADALACASYYIAYSQLSDAARAALKEHVRAQHKDAWMAENPPSEHQIRYLRSLGYAGTPASMRDASDTIDRLLALKARVAR